LQYLLQVGNAVTCAQILGKITEGGVYLEQLETNPQKYMPEITDASLGGDVVKVHTF